MKRWLVGLVIAINAWVSAEQPNIVILVADDLGWNNVGYHNPEFTTPHLDQLVEEGIELDRFYTAANCSPTRAGLLTGRYPIRYGMAQSVVYVNQPGGLPLDERILPQVLADAGYEHRGIFGKWHLGRSHLEYHPMQRGFTEFMGLYTGEIHYFTHTRMKEVDWHLGYEPLVEEGYSTELIAKAAAAFIADKAKGDAPYFCYVPFNAIHKPLEAKEEYVERFGAVDKAMVYSLDEGIGRILEAIKKSGEEENTQVWFFSDNGGGRYSKKANLPFRGGKGSTYEGGNRIPACVRWPAKWPGGRKLDEHVGYIDVLPTVLETVGVPANEQALSDKPLDGISLHGLFSGQEEHVEERDWYSYYGQRFQQVSIHSYPWKLVVTGDGKVKNGLRYGLKDLHKVELFRIREDASEQNNVADQHPEVVQRLVAKLVDWCSLQRPGAKDSNTDKNKFKGWTPPKNWQVGPSLHAQGE